MIDHLTDEWLDIRVGSTLPCPGCALDSRIPTPEESEWPDRKDHDDPMRDVPVTERPRQGAPAETPVEDTVEPTAWLEEGADA